MTCEYKDCSQNIITKGSLALSVTIVSNSKGASETLPECEIPEENCPVKKILNDEYAKPMNERGITGETPNCPVVGVNLRRIFK